MQESGVGLNPLRRAISRALSLAGVILGCSLPLAAAQPGTPEPLPAYFKTGVLTFEDRVWAQTQIERVYYNHRIWPKENPGPKPPFEKMVPAARIAGMITDTRRKSVALEVYWRREVSQEMLQAELERMAKDTQDPEMLRELFKAVHDNPELAAEALARPLLVDRLIREWYARDSRFHGEARRRAEAIAAGAAGSGGDTPDAVASRREVLLDETPGVAERAHDNEGPRAPMRVDAGRFAAIRGLLPAPGAPFRIRETARGFLLLRTVSQSASRLEFESVFVAKTGFDQWWGGESPKFGEREFVRLSPDRDSPLRLAAPSLTAGCDQWSSSAQMNNVLPLARTGHTAVWTGSEMIIWGGYPYDPSGIVFGISSGGRYSPATDTWGETAPIGTPGGRLSHTAVWTGTEMIVWGGTYDTGDALNSGGRYDPAADTWTATSNGANVPIGRTGHTAVWTGSLMIIWGGFPQSGYSNEGGRYDPSTDAWTPTSVGTNVPASRGGHSAVWTGTLMIIWGGSITNTGGRYNPATDTWTPTSIGVNVPSARLYHTAVWTGSEMVVWGGCWDGYCNGPLATGGRYTPGNDKWSALSTGTNHPAGRYAHAAVWSGTEMLIWGGYASASGYFNSGGRYNPTKNSWQTMSQGANLPAARRNATAVWTGSEMIAWGGSGSEFFDSGGRYSPSSDSWVPTSTGAAVPEPRDVHSAIWTGSEMIVWGGYNYWGDYDENSGGRYNPATDSWTATRADATTPEWRDGHIAVWTGSEMIIWGGVDGCCSLGSGGRYNPAADSWLSTSTGANAPARRRNHRAVWTGSEMIVWGGKYGATHYNDGGRYDPVNDSWLQTPLLGAPAPRRSHEMVWTGKAMLVWGGTDDGANNFNTGGIYSPLSDSWTAIALDAATPDGRYGPRSAWTGTEMLIWGGGLTYAPMNSGGKYNPVTEHWSPTSLTGAPQGRFDFQPVWTGSEFIFWGGTPDGYGAIGDGARYSPAADRWLPVSSAKPAPPPLFVTSTVWTGSKMILWGGFNSYMDVNIGRFYESGSPASPAGSLRAGKSATIDLNWTAVSGAVSYNLRRCVASGAACVPSAIIASPASNSYSEAMNATSYFYAVESVNACGTTP